MSLKDLISTDDSKFDEMIRAQRDLDSDLETDRIMAGQSRFFDEIGFNINVR